MFEHVSRHPIHEHRCWRRRLGTHLHVFSLFSASAFMRCGTHTLTEHGTRARVRVLSRASSGASLLLCRVICVLTFRDIRTPACERVCVTCSDIKRRMPQIRSRICA